MHHCRLYRMIQNCSIIDCYLLVVTLSLVDNTNTRCRGRRVIILYLPIFDFERTLHPHNVLSSTYKHIA